MPPRNSIIDTMNMNMKIKKISIVIPTLNNRVQINKLSHGLNTMLSEAGIDHTITCFDRGSTDGTVEYLQSIYPEIPIETEKLTPGQKLTKVLINHSAINEADYVVLIDPGYIPAAIVLKELLNNINEQDVLFPSFNKERVKQRLHPGVIIIKSSVLTHLLEVGDHKEKILQWSLIQHARHLGYEVTNQTTKEIAPFKKSSWSATLWPKAKLAFTYFPPYHLPPENKETMNWAGIHYNKARFITHTTIRSQHSAVATLTSSQKLILFSLGGGLLTSLVLNWHLTLLVLFSSLVILYFLDLLFNVFIIFRSLFTNPEIVITDEDVHSLGDKKLPLITVLCPLYKEEAILPQFIEAMSSFDYPKDKLQVLLLLEEDDKGTIDVANKIASPFIQILLVPNSLPRTKPKALNWGLGHAKGEYIVIYDAEDVPEKDQLKKAVITFDRVGKDVFCLQAKLNFYNPDQNLLTRLFTAEYSLWFDLILTGLYSIAAPIPLGGTSNFFRTKDIINVEGWDAFNVCEDCDLGLRLYKRGHKTALFNSTTFEEANSNLDSWIKQRSHWIKGYIQGFFVHIRSPRGFIRSIREPHLFTFLLVVGGKTLSVFINPFLWIMTISYFLFRPIVGHLIESFYPAPIFYMGMFTLILGNSIYLYNYMLGCARRKYWNMVIFCVFVPIYWLLMSFAAWKALYQLIVKPYYWEKTTHGLHINKN
jgi:cellulose synthase/poly-beta-1,6-N-acetylglucosamine synthase-like glycosyltransferase